MANGQLYADMRLKDVLESCVIRRAIGPRTCGIARMCAKPQRHQCQMSVEWADWVRLTACIVPNMEQRDVNAQRNGANVSAEAVPNVEQTM